MDAAQPMIAERGLTLVGIAVGNLDDAADQGSLPFDPGRPTGQRGSALDTALDDVRHRFGAGAITRAVQIGREQGISVPILPD
jgi:DNA polymerase-4